jgi:hypothetical protein
MKRIVLIIPFCYCCLLSFHAYSQGFSLEKSNLDHHASYPEDEINPYTFNANVYSYTHLEEDLRDVDESFIRSHPIDIEVAKRLHLFEEQYSIYSEAAPGAYSGQKTIQKPILYSSVYRIDKYFRKQLRTGSIDIDAAKHEMCTILDTAIILLHYDTHDFEQALRKSRSADEMVTLFKYVQLIASVN